MDKKPAISIQIPSLESRVSPEAFTDFRTNSLLPLLQLFIHPASQSSFDEVQQIFKISIPCGHSRRYTALLQCLTFQTFNLRVTQYAVYRIIHSLESFSLSALQYSSNRAAFCIAEAKQWHFTYIKPLRIYSPFGSFSFLTSSSSSCRLCSFSSCFSSSLNLSYSMDEFESAISWLISPACNKSSFPFS